MVNTVSGVTLQPRIAQYNRTYALSHCILYPRERHIFTPFVPIGFLKSLTLDTFMMLRSRINLRLLISGHRIHFLCSVHVRLHLVAKDGRNFLQCETLGVGVEEETNDGEEIGRDDEAEIELPSDLLESQRCDLQPHDVHEGYGANTECHALRPEVLREKLGVVDVLRPIEKQLCEGLMAILSVSCAMVDI